MSSLFTININITADLQSVNEKLTKILNQMATKEDFQAALTEVTTALDNIAQDIQRLTDQLETGSLTAEEEEEVFAQLRAVADKAKALADATPDAPTPEPEP